MDFPMPHRSGTVFNRITQTASLFACAFGALALVGWQFDIAILKNIGTNSSSTLKPIAAALFILAGISLWLTRKQTPPEFSRAYRIGQALAFLVMLAGLLTLAEYAFHWNPGFDQWLFREAVLKEVTPFPGRLAVVGGVYFALLGLAMLLAATPPRWRLNHRLAQIFIGIIFLISLVNVFGIIYGLEKFSLAALITITLHNAPTYFVVLCIGVFAAHPEWGLPTLLAGEHIGSQIARRLFPTAILIPLIVGWVRLKFEQAGLFQNAFIASLNGVITSAVLGLAIWLIAQSLNRADQRRSQVEESLREREQKLSTLLNLLPVGISILDQERKVTFQNAALSQILELTPEGLRAGVYKNRKYLIADGTPMPADGFASVQAEKSRAAVYDLETGVVKEDGATVWTSVSAVPVDFPDWKTVIVTADITPRKQADKILQDERHNLDALIENIDGSIWSVDAQYRLIVGNTRYHHDTSAALGRKLVEGESVLVESFPPAALAEWRGYYDRALQGENFSVEVQTRFADPVHHVEYRFNPIRTSAGAIMGVTVFGRDITKSKQAEMKLRESEERLELVLEGSQLGYWDWNIETGKVHRNALWAEMLGYTLQEVELTVKQWSDLQHPDDQAAAWKSIQDHLDGKTPAHRIEYRMRTKDGQYKWILDQARVVQRDAQGKPLRMSGTHTDVTERKLAEAALHESGEFIRLAYEAADLGIWKNDLQTGSVEFDERARIHYGFDTLHTTLAEVTSRVHPDDLANLGAEIAAATAPTGSGKFATEYRVIHPDGSVHWLAIGVRVTFEGEGAGRQALIGYGTSLDITERKQAEETIRESQELFLKAFHSNPAAMVISRTADGLLKDFNASYERMFEYTREELIGKTSASVNIITPEARHVIIEKLQADGHVYSYETTFRTKSGKIINALFSIEKIELAGEQCMLTIIYDITDRKLAEEALRQSQHKYSMLFEKAAVPAALTKMPEAVFADVNEAFQKNFGYSREDVIGKTSVEIGMARPEERERTALELKQHDQLRDNEKHLYTKTGEARTALINVGKARIDDQEYVITTIHDVTEQKQAEHALQLSRESFSKAFEANPAALVITRRADEKLIRINSAYTRMIGYAPAEIIGRFAGEVNIYANLADRQEVMRLLQEHGSVHDHEVLLQGKTGELHSVVVSVEPLEFEGEECLLTALLDVTERKRMEDELRRSNAELEQFAYIASHDLQEPLRTIAGMVQLLQKRYQGQLDERADEYIGHTVESASRMQALIRDLLAYSRVDRKNQPIAPVSAQDCLQSALKNLRVAIEESHATITADDLPTVHADPTQLTQLFQNLIGNSLKFHSAEPPQVHITATQLPDAWQFAVRDNGIGIEPQYFERIFLVFQRLHTRRQYQGTGIGLALCKKIIERHGGSIWLESKPGQGSIFYFTLPLRSNP